jgi:hypothetical protein
MSRKKVIIEEPEISSYIPTGFMLGGTYWNVIRYIQGDPTMKGRPGDSSDITNEVRIVSQIEWDAEIMKIPLDKQEENFYHELTHAILSQLGDKMTRNEQFVQSFGALLYQFIKTAQYTTVITSKIGFNTNP